MRWELRWRRPEFTGSSPSSREPSCCEADAASRLDADLVTRPGETSAAAAATASPPAPLRPSSRALGCLDGGARAGECGLPTRAPAAAAAKPAADIPDSLWSEFETMAQQKTDREKEREQEEARELAESAAKEQAKLEEEERKVREVAEANAAAKRAEEEAEAAKKKALEEERARARAEIGGMAQTVDMAPEKVGSMMKEFEG